MNIILKSGKTCNLLLTPTHKNEHKKRNIEKGSSSDENWSTIHCSVAAALAGDFCILGNKIAKNMKIFVEVDEIRSRGVLCQL